MLLEYLSFLNATSYLILSIFFLFYFHCFFCSAIFIIIFVGESVNMLVFPFFNWIQQIIYPVQALDTWANLRDLFHFEYFLLAVLKGMSLLSLIYRIFSI